MFTNKLILILLYHKDALLMFKKKATLSNSREVNLYSSVFIRVVSSRAPLLDTL